MALCPGTVFRIGDFGARGSAEEDGSERDRFDPKAQPATASRASKTAEAITEGRGASVPRLKPQQPQAASGLLWTGGHGTEP